MKSSTSKNNMWDVVVVGGGPAGMMAAARAAERGRKVLLVEKNKTLGKKLLITGGGRCNVTNNKPDTRAMLAKYKENDKFLFSAFSQFGVPETLEFFHSRGMPTKEEQEGRVFPLSNTAQSVWDTVVGYMKQGGVEVRTGAAVSSMSVDPATRGITLHLKDKTELQTKACVVATGGVSHPETGSTGEGLGWLKSLGHTAVPSDLSLVPIALSDAWAKRLGGVTLSGVKLTLFQNGIKKSVHNGKLLFTHFGISGPTVLNMSREVGDLLEYGGDAEVPEVTILLDLFPTQDLGGLRKKLQDVLVAQSNRKLKNVLGSFIPSALVPALLELSGVDGETPCHSVRTLERSMLTRCIKALPLHVTSLLGADKAVISSGGVVPEEVNFKTMESRKVRGLYLVGDVLHIDRPSGGYSLQLCWTTGYVAGNSV